jgi:hypothetical protein
MVKKMKSPHTIKMIAMAITMIQLLSVPEAFSDCGVESIHPSEKNDNLKRFAPYGHDDDIGQGPDEKPHIDKDQNQRDRSLRRLDPIGKLFRLLAPSPGEGRESDLRKSNIEKQEGDQSQERKKNNDLEIKERKKTHGYPFNRKKTTSRVTRRLSIPTPEKATRQ